MPQSEHSYWRIETAEYAFQILLGLQCTDMEEAAMRLLLRVCQTTTVCIFYHEFQIMHNAHEHFPLARVLCISCLRVCYMCQQRIRLRGMSHFNLTIRAYFATSFLGYRSSKRCGWSCWDSCEVSSFLPPGAWMLYSSSFPLIKCKNSRTTSSGTLILHLFRANSQRKMACKTRIWNRCICSSFFGTIFESYPKTDAHKFWNMLDEWM